MPRPPRMLKPLEFYHVVSRGNNKQILFFEDKDYRILLSLITDYIKTFDVSLIHYCLMPNHIHLLLMQQKDNQGIIKVMQGFKMKYAFYYHRKRNATGTVWEGRFRSFHVNSSGYLLECGRYIERNPVKAGMVEDPSQYPYSSYGYYASGHSSNCVSGHRMLFSSKGPLDPFTAWHMMELSSVLPR